MLQTMASVLISMPVMDGYETTRRIRKAENERQKAADSGQESENEGLQSTIRTPIIALTASAFEEHREHVLAAGCDGFVKKPFQEIEVFEIMTHLSNMFDYDEILRLLHEAYASKSPGGTTSL